MESSPDQHSKWQNSMAQSQGPGPWQRQATAPETAAANEPAAYFRHERLEVKLLLPARARRILDIGCGEGTTLAWLKGHYPAAVTSDLKEIQVFAACLQSTQMSRISWI